MVYDGSDHGRREASCLGDEEGETAGAADPTTPPRCVTLPASSVKPVYGLSPGFLASPARGLAVVGWLSRAITTSTAAISRRTTEPGHSMSPSRCWPRRARDGGSGSPMPDMPGTHSRPTCLHRRLCRCPNLNFPTSSSRLAASGACPCWHVRLAASRTHASKDLTSGSCGGRAAPTSGACICWRLPRFRWPPPRATPRHSAGIRSGPGPDRHQRSLGRTVPGLPGRDYRRTHPC
jgi:hypothetical protein